MIETAKLLAALLVDQFEVPPDRVFLANQKWNIPKDDGLFFELNPVSTRLFASDTSYRTDDDTGNQIEVSCINTRETFGLMMFSKGDAARQRKHEIGHALSSTYAQQMCEANAVKLSNIPTEILDVSETEGAARLNKFALSFTVLRAYTRERNAAFYDKFPIDSTNRQTLITDQ